MKRIITVLLMIMIVSFVACQKATSKDTMEKDTGFMEKQPTSDATVDSVENDLNNVDNVDKDLSSDELSDLDSGLSDVENI